MGHLARMQTFPLFFGLLRSLPHIFPFSCFSFCPGSLYFVHFRSFRQFVYVQSRPRASVTFVQRNKKTKTSGKLRLSSTFLWPITECAQLHRKLMNNNYVPRFPILSRTRRMCQRKNIAMVLKVELILCCNIIWLNFVKPLLY